MQVERSRGLLFPLPILSTCYVFGIVVGAEDKEGKKTEFLCSWWWSALEAILEIQKVKGCGRILASKQEIVSGQT